MSLFKFNFDKQNSETKDYYEEQHENLAETIEELTELLDDEQYSNLNNKKYFQDVVSSLRTISDLIRWVYTYLSRHDVFFGHGYDNAWDEARTLVLSRLYLPLTVDSDYILNARVTKTEKIEVIKLTALRVHQSIPLAYLLKKAHFLGRWYYVDERVIIPRSPMGELIENGFKGVIQSYPSTILDMCTGSGCLAFAIAERFPASQIDAVDISPEALEVAQENFDIIGEEVEGLEDRLVFIESDLFANLPEGAKYDLIVSNPPYVDEDDLATMPTEFSHEPSISLGSGSDGLYLTTKILQQAPNYLNNNGTLIVEVGNSKYNLIEALPNVPFNWVELQNGGHGIFTISREQLISYKKDIDSFVETHN